MKFLVCPKCNSRHLDMDDSIEPYIKCLDCGYGVFDYETEDEIKNFIASDNKLSRIFDDDYKLKDEYKVIKHEHGTSGGKRFLVDVIKATPFELYVHAAHCKADVYNRAICHDGIVSEYDISYRSSLMEQGRIVIEIDLMKSIIIANGGMFSNFITLWREK